ncbi:MAG: hypothetical protein AAF193_09125, partial [Bacteroidota bacterium]
MDFELVMMVGSITQQQKELFGKDWCEVVGRENVVLLQKAALAITSIGDSKRFTMVPFDQND